MNGDSEFWPRLDRLITAPGLASLGPEARAGVQTVQALDAALDSTLSLEQLTPRARELIRGTLLLWHDHLDEAHAIAQDIEDRDGSLLHAIMHRREPDYGNAKYWFRRVGAHPVYSAVGAAASSLIRAQAPEWAGRLVRAGALDAYAFVDACEAASDRDGAELFTAALQEVQRLETVEFLKHVAGLRAE